jgi:hypothetical protein
LLLVTPAAASHDKTDIVKVDDGGVYVGEIKSVKYRTLSFDTDPAGVIGIEWRYVTELTSKFEYRVELDEGVRHYGTLGSPKEPGKLSIVGPSGPVEVDLEDVVEIVPIEHGFWKRLDGSVNFGLTYTQANNAFQYNLSGDVNYRSRRNLATLDGQSIFNTQDDAESTSQHNLTLVVSQVPKGRKRWGPFEVGQLASNPAQGYDQRFLVGAGAAGFLIESSRKLLTVNLGAAYNRENVTDGLDPEDSAEALVGFNFRRFKRGSHSPNVRLSLNTFTNVTDTPRFRAIFVFSVDWEIVGDLKFTLKVRDSYDSNPPGTDSNNNDLTVVNSIGYTF